jgi:hypothetical protein
MTTRPFLHSIVLTGMMTPSLDARAYRNRLLGNSTDLAAGEAP